MPKYITVLNSDLSKPYHVAVQWDDNLQSLKQNLYYSAGHSMNIPKKTGDINKGNKIVTEVATGSQGQATMLSLEAETVTMSKVAENRSSKAFMNKIKKGL